MTSGLPGPAQLRDRTRTGDRENRAGDRQKNGAESKGRERDRKPGENGKKRREERMVLILRQHKRIMIK